MIVMTWWIWLLLVVFMLAVLFAGLTYVVLRALALMHVATALGTTVSERFGRLDAKDPDSTPTRAIFTEPLQVASDNYATAHSRVIARKMAARRRHIERWKSWLRFNR